VMRAPLRSPSLKQRISVIDPDFVTWAVLARHVARLL
jgi:hypothetical protein